MSQHSTTCALLVHNTACDCQTPITIGRVFFCASCARLAAKGDALLVRTWGHGSDVACSHHIAASLNLG